MGLLGGDGTGEHMQGISPLQVERERERARRRWMRGVGAVQLASCLLKLKNINIRIGGLYCIKIRN